MDTSTAAVIADLRSATSAAFALLERLAKTAAEGDEWTRLPAGKNRCPVSNWSRSTILRKIDAGEVRGKHRGASRFYSLADVRRLLQSP